MRDMRHDDELGRDDQAFVDRVSAAYRAPELPPSRRVAFREALDRRMADGTRARRWRAAGLLACGALALALAWLGTTLPSPVAPETTNVARAPTPAETGLEAPLTIAADTTPEEALLSFSDEPLSDEATSLPADYEAIESLFLGG